MWRRISLSPFFSASSLVSTTALMGISTTVNSDALRNRGTRPFQRMQTEKDLRSAAKRNRARRRRYRRVLIEDIVEFLRADGFRQIAVHPRG